MGSENVHKKGSLAYRPRKRAKKETPSVGYWPEVSEKRVLGFAGYKAGMTHITYIDDSDSPNKGLEISAPVTILEAPPLVCYGIRAYKDKRVLSDSLVLDEKVLKPLGIKPKKKVEFSPSEIDDVFLLVYTQPFKTKFGKKTPERMEIAIGGKDVAEKLEFAKGLLGKEIRAGEALRIGEYVDVIAVTKGKGWAGARKRFGISLQRRKATGRVRHVGTLGPWHPAYVMYTVPMAGQLGYHKRTELSKRVMKIGEGKEINVKGGFVGYGNIISDYIMLHGSVPGPRKRLIRLRKAVWEDGAKVPEIKYISTASKQ